MNTSEKTGTLAAIFWSCSAWVVFMVQTAILQKQAHAAGWSRLSKGQGRGQDYRVSKEKTRWEV